MLHLNYRFHCKQCKKKSIIRLHAGDVSKDLTLRCEHCGETYRMSREEFRGILGNLSQFKKYIKI